MDFVKMRHKEWFDNNDDNTEWLLKIKHFVKQVIRKPPDSKRTLKDEKAILQRGLRKMKLFGVTSLKKFEVTLTGMTQRICIVKFLMIPHHFDGKTFYQPVL